MNPIIENQLALILLCFVVGTIGAATMLWRGSSARAWRIADLIWVICGGLGAITAVVAGIYTEDSSRIERRVDVAFALTKEFERDTARFRLSHCEEDWQGPRYRSHVLALCDKVEFLSASTSGSRRLPLFLDVASKRAPLSSLRILPGFQEGESREIASYSGMVAEAGGFDPATLRTFDAHDQETMTAVDALARAPGHAAIAAEFLVIAQTYDELIEQVKLLRDEWQYLRENALVLSLQILAIGLVAFAAPFRLGKSVFDLR